MFLIPPEQGRFRVVAQRSVVVDWKTFPFYEPDMVEWMRRIEACYGPVDTKRRDRVGPLTKRYRSINDDQLRKLQAEFALRYAVLYLETPTDLRVVASDNRFKLVELPLGSRSFLGADHLLFWHN